MTDTLEAFRHFREKMNAAIRCREEGVSDPEFFDAFAVALVVGGSIVIPHLRHAVARLEELPAK